MEPLQRQFEPSQWQMLERLGHACAAAGGRACLVGGCIRSAILGEAVLDYDVEVFGLAPEGLERVLGQLSSFSKVGKSFGIYKLGKWPIDVGLPRSERKSGSGHRGFEVDIHPEMSIHDAALRRDFTINAIYFDILEREIVDPLGGIKDLQERHLRHCSDRFPEDPLRVLRAMQFAARIPAEVSPATIELCRNLTPEALSRERFYGEWEKLLLQGKKPSNGLNFLKACGWVRFFPELQAMVDCPQDPSWHPEGDVWSHTAHCLDAFAQQRSGNPEEDLIVGFSVLCHDMGKPRTTEFADGKIRSHGHETAGVRPTLNFLNRLNVPKRIQEQILPLVKCHMRPAMLYASGSSAAAIRRLARDSGRLDLLLRVYQADAAGRPPMPDDSAEAIEWIRAKAREMNVERDKPSPIIKGRHLLERNWSSGPAMGRFLSRAYEAQLDGEFTDEESASEWLENQNPKKPS